MWLYCAARKERESTGNFELGVAKLKHKTVRRPATTDDCQIFERRETVRNAFLPSDHRIWSRRHCYRHIIH